MEKEEIERLVNTPLITGKDLRLIMKPFGLSYYKSRKIFTTMRETYLEYAEANHFVVFQKSVPNAIAFDFLKQFGVTKEKLLDESYWK